MTRYTGPAIPTNGDHIHEVPSVAAGFFESDYDPALVGMTTEAQQWAIMGEEITTEAQQYAIMGADPEKVTDFHQLPIDIKVPAGMQVTGKAKCWRKGDDLYCCICVQTDAGARLMVSTKVPLAPIRKLAANVAKNKAIELGWNPFKSIKKGGRWLGRTVKKAATSKVASKLTDIVQSPQFQQIAQAAAPAALAAFGVPPQITTGALQLVNAAQSRSIPPYMKQQAMAKVQNITSQATQGNPAAQKLWSVMSTYYRQGIPGILAAPPQFPMPQMSPWGMSPYIQPPYRGAPMQPQMMPRYPYLPPGMHAFSVPYGGVRLSGWLYNVPYRSNLSAMSLDKQNPGHAIRYLYNQGMSR